MNTTYVIKTSRGAGMLAYDNLERAREAMRYHQKRFTSPLKLYRQTVVEEEVA